MNLRHSAQTSKCDGSLMTEPVSRIGLSTPIKAIRI